MTALELFLWILLGIAVQAGLFLAAGFWRHWQSYLRLRQLLPDGIEPAAAAEPAGEYTAGWPGFRDFTVVRRVTEDAAGQVCSFWLEPADEAALPSFRPGQFLTFRLDIPAAGGAVEKVIRCYSLSDAHRPDHYRVSVKRVPAPPGSGHPPGRSSNFFHDHVRVGTTLQVRAPAGHFFLDAGNGPVVLVAGGIGITPMLAMLETCRQHQPGREVWLYYGVRNGSEAAFATHLREIAAASPDIHLRLCFSDPRPEDRAGQDFHHQGRVDVQRFRMELPLRPFHYYLCGPTPMMESLVAALDDWGVPASRIQFEAFGPASIRRRDPGAAADADNGAADAGTVRVTFARSGRQAAWSPGTASLLEFAESQGIAMESGCRAGACGSCQTVIRSGEVAYRQAPDFDPEPGTCLACVCTPRTDLTLEA